jgi:hypothetical protein
MESLKGSLNGIDGIVTCCRLDSPRSNTDGGEIFCVIQTGPQGPPSLLYIRYWVFPEYKVARAWY